MILSPLPRTALLTGSTILLLLAQSAFAQTTGADMTLSLTPHCTNADRSACPAFTVTNVDHMKTGKMAAGDILDLDVVVTGSQYAQVETIESWLKYDPSALEARSVEATDAIGSPTPGEQTIDVSLGIVKIGGGTKGTLKTNTTAIARVTFRVIASTANTDVSFYGYSLDGTGQTTVNGPYGKKADAGTLPAPPCFGDVIGCRGAPNPLLATQPSTLTVILTDPAASSASSLSASSLSQSSSTSSLVQSTSGAASTSSSVGTQSSATSSATNATGTSAFPLLQIQGVRVTSKDTAAFLAWQALRSAETAGYNVYYGTVSGRYIQRRSVASTDTSLTIRDLALGSTYYFGIRGVSTSGQESQFSQEVAVTIGKPETSTAPMTATIITPVAPISGNPVSSRQGQIIQGETGIGSTILLLLLISAVTGTALAFRRQLALTHTTPHGI